MKRVISVFICLVIVFLNCYMAFGANYSGFSLVDTWVMNDGSVLVFYDDGTFDLEWGIYGVESGSWYVDDMSGDYFEIEMNGSSLLLLMSVIYGSTIENYHFEILKCNNDNIYLVQVYGGYNAVTSPCKLGMTREGCVQNLTIPDIEITEYSGDSENAYRNIKSKSIPFRVDENRVINVDIDWTWEFFESDASKYNHTLTMAGLLLSSATEESESQIKKVLTGGYNGFELEHFDSIYYNDDRDVFCDPTAFASKQITINGEKKIIVTMVCTGTEMWTNDVWTDAYSIFDGFEICGNNSYNALSNYIKKIRNNHYYDIEPDYDNTIFFITGHSLGGATAQFVAGKIDGTFAPGKNIFTYVFASPNVQTGYERTVSYTNIHNIINGADLIPLVPIGFGKFGHSWYYLEASDEYDEAEEKVFGSSYNAASAELNILYNHLPNRYLTFILSGLPVNMTRRVSNPFKLSSVHCPVDIRVYDKDMNLMSYTENGEAFNSRYTKVLIYVDGDSKYVVAPDNVDYTIEFTATDDGEMTYIQQSFDGESEDAFEEQTFENVSLEKGQVFVADVFSDEPAESVKLVESEGITIENGKSSGSGSKTVLIIVFVIMALMIIGLAVVLIVVQGKQRKRYW